MNRVLVFALLLAVAGVLLIPFPPSAGTGSASAQEARYGAPYGLVNCDEVPYKVPERWETEEDRRHRPYELLVRLYAWPGLGPMDADLAQLLVPGAQRREKRGFGTFVFSGIDIGVTSVALYQFPKGPGPHADADAVLLGFRNPLCLARDAVTVCDLVAVPLEERSLEIRVRGIVSDRFTLAPLEGAALVLPSGMQELSDASGHFSFPLPVTMEQVLEIGLVRTDYRDLGVLLQFLSNLTWAEHFRDTGEMLLGMRPELEKPVLRPLLPLDEIQTR